MRVKEILPTGTYRLLRTSMMEHKWYQVDKVHLFLAIIFRGKCCIVAIELQHDLETKE